MPTSSAPNPSTGSGPRGNPALSREIAQLDRQLAGCVDPMKRAYLVRTRISFLLVDTSKHPDRYNNADTLDLIRDIATAFKMEFKVIRDERQRQLLHVFVHGQFEEKNFKPNQNNSAWMGWCERSHGAQGIQGSKA